MAKSARPRIRETRETDTNNKQRVSKSGCGYNGGLPCDRAHWFVHNAFWHRQRDTTYMVRANLTHRWPAHLGKGLFVLRERTKSLLLNLSDANYWCVIGQTSDNACAP